MQYLHNNGIGSQVLYIPVFLQPYYKKKYNYNPRKFPISMKYYEQALSIPIFYSLTKNEQSKIIKKIKKILN
jgi:dTDP-4-amino-4,6-dideoxygalactose transaminase